MGTHPRTSHPSKPPSRGKLNHAAFPGPMASDVGRPAEFRRSEARRRPPAPLPRRKACSAPPKVWRRSWRSRPREVIEAEAEAQAFGSGVHGDLAVGQNICIYKYIYIYTEVLKMEPGKIETTTRNSGPLLLNVGPYPWKIVWYTQYIYIYMHIVYCKKVSF